MTRGSGSGEGEGDAGGTPASEHRPLEASMMPDEEAESAGSEDFWDADRPGARSGRRRITLDFSGPPLALPGEGPQSSAEVRSEGDLSALQLDMSELSGSAFPSDAPTLSRRLDLDLESIGGNSVREGLGDAWSRELEEPSEGGSLSPPIPTDPSALPQDERLSLRPTSRPRPVSSYALELVSRSRPPPPHAGMPNEMSERYALGDYGGALHVAELILGTQPEDPEALRCAESSRKHLEQLYCTQLGSLESVPQVAIDPSEVRWLGIDHRAGFLLSRIDGLHTVEDVLDMSGMPRIEALKMLTELLEAGAIVCEG